MNDLDGHQRVNPKRREIRVVLFGTEHVAQLFTQDLEHHRPETRAIRCELSMQFHIFYHSLSIWTGQDAIDVPEAFEAEYPVQSGIRPLDLEPRLCQRFTPWRAGHGAKRLRSAKSHRIAAGVSTRNATTRVGAKLHLALKPQRNSYGSARHSRRNCTLGKGCNRDKCLRRGTRSRLR